MVRATKQTTPTPTPAPVAAAAAPEKKAASTKKAAAPAAAPAAEKKAEEPAGDVAAAPAGDEVPGEDLVELLTAFGNKINQGYTFFAGLKTQFKTLQKAVLKAHKTAQKVSNRKNRRSGNRKPSGFVRPALISNELAAFLGKPAGTEMARTDVSKEINNYIRNNKLQDEKNGRQINADAKLSALLKLQGEDSLTYFNLQRYMKHHFVKPATPAVATA